MSLSKVIAAVLVVLVLALFGYRVNARVEDKKRAESVVAPVASVSTVAPVRRTMTRTLRLTGVVRPANEVDVFARMPVRVERVLVKVGDKVKAGDVLAVLEGLDIALQVKQAKAQLLSARAGLEKARADAKSAEQTTERMRNLRKEDALSQADLEKTESMLMAAQTGAKMAEAQVAVVESSVALAREMLSQRRLTTPVAGTVTRRAVNIGTLASPVMAAFQVQDASALKLEGMVDPADFLRLKVGQPVQVRVDSLGDAIFTGSIATLSPTLDAQTRRAAVEITIDNKGGQLLANMLGAAEIKLGTVDGVLAVPAAAVVSLPTGRGLYLARDGKATVLQSSLGQVALGSEEEGFIEVTAGLTDTDQVIVSDQNMLSNGTPLKIASAKPAPGAAQ
jgi:RND family efflux transporter MFP subunit